MLATEKLGDYEIIQLLAAGGMAEIFLARKTGPGGFEKRVVVKRIAKKLLGDREVEAMFLDEARVQALLDHPNIVQIYEFGEDKGSYYIAMEFVPGATLRWVVDNATAVGRPVPIAHALRIIADVLAGLHFAHDRRDAKGRPLGLIHRDISPVNVLVSRAGVAKVCDFGVAKSKLQSVMTRVGIIKGKFRYMSPEQVSGSPLDRRSDVFAVGTVLFEVLAGRRLFNQEPEEAVVPVIRSGRYPCILDYRPDAPRAIDQILQKSLVLDPDKRFENTREFAHACERVLHSLPQGCSSMDLAEYLASELEGTAGLEDKPNTNRDPALLSGSFLALDPPVPQTVVTPLETPKNMNPAKPRPAPRRKTVQASSAGKMLAALLLAPSLVFTGLGLGLEAVFKALSSPKQGRGKISNQ